MLEAKRSEKEKDAHVAMVAIQLGMLDDAERLYVRCGRYDLLNKMYQASGQWDKAIEVAQKKDRIHLKVTYLLWARQLEAAGELRAAIGCYEKADAHRTEVPRMLQERRQFDMLKEYITQSNDAELNKWMGNFCESQQRLDAAINYYDKAGDVLALVRVRCYQAQHDESAEARRAALTGAQDLVETSGNAAAALFLARQFETLGQPRDALRMYEKAGRYKHAVRVARSCVYVYIHTYTHTHIHTYRQVQARGAHRTQCGGDPRPGQTGPPGAHGHDAGGSRVFGVGQRARQGGDALQQGGGEFAGAAAVLQPPAV